MVALGGSLWACEVRGDHAGALPDLDYAAHRAVCDLIRGLVAAQCAGVASLPMSGVHDVSSGGLAVCLAELCCASGLGATVTETWSVEEVFSEVPSRVLVCTSDAGAMLAAAEDAGVPARVIGRAGGDRLIVPGLFDLELLEVISVRSNRLPEAADRATA